MTDVDKYFTLHMFLLYKKDIFFQIIILTFQVHFADGSPTSDSGVAFSDKDQGTYLISTGN